MRCPSCHAKCSPSASACGSCGCILPQSCSSRMRPVSRLAYWICRSGRETLAVFCLSLLIFTGASLTLSFAAAVYEPLTAAAGLNSFSLYTTDGQEPLTNQEVQLLKDKASQARTLAEEYGIGAFLGLLLFSGSLLVLVRVFFVSNRLRSAAPSNGPGESAASAHPAEPVVQSTALPEQSAVPTEATEPPEPTTESAAVPEQSVKPEPAAEESTNPSKG